MIHFLLSFVLSFNISASGAEAPRPNPEITKGALCTEQSVDFDGYRYPERIAHCKREVPWAMRQEVYRMYGIPAMCRKFYTIDHFIPLSLGGSNDITNLWPEHKDVKATRPGLERELYYSLRGGHIGQDRAIEIVVHEKTHAPVVNIRTCG